MKSSLGFTVKRKTEERVEWKNIGIQKLSRTHKRTKNLVKSVLLSLSRHICQLDQTDMLKRCNTLRDFSQT